MTKSDLINMPVFFDRYINLVDGDLISSLASLTPLNIFKYKEKLEALKDSVYEPHKWTIKSILQHCIDTERIMTYRALSIARGEKTPLPGFDENEFAKNAFVNERTISDLLEEYEIVRQSSIYLFKNLDNEMLLREGIANTSTISPLALGFVIVGHSLHHYRIIEERYFPLLEAQD